MDIWNAYTSGHMLGLTAVRITNSKVMKDTKGLGLAQSSDLVIELLYLEPRNGSFLATDHCKGA